MLILPRTRKIFYGSLFYKLYLQRKRASMCTSIKRKKFLCNDRKYFKRGKMNDKIYYKINAFEIHEKHFYKMIRFVWFRTFVFCVDVYPSQITISFLLAHNRMTRCSRSFNIAVIKWERFYVGLVFMSGEILFLITTTIMINT